jgi:hypothetical protein
MPISAFGVEDNRISKADKDDDRKRSVGAAAGKGAAVGAAGGAALGTVRAQPAYRLARGFKGWAEHGALRRVGHLHIAGSAARYAAGGAAVGAGVRALRNRGKKDQ